MSLLESGQFLSLIKKKLPIGTKLPNPGGGDTTILSYQENNICYGRGKSRFYIDYNHLYGAYQKYYGEKVSSTDLKEYNPQVFDPDFNGHGCNCTFFFQIAVAIGVASKIQGEGKRGDPFYVTLVP